MASELKLYFHIILFSIAVFTLTFLYINWLGIPSPVNKAVADTGILLMGFSMVLSSICYFWNFLDKTIVYRKYLGLVGFAFAFAHVLLSWSAFLRLFNMQTWQTNSIWAPLSGGIALVIFTVMAAISNTWMAKAIGGKVWKTILRTGYIGVLFVALHVFFLKSERWITWMQKGFQEPPSASFIVSLFMLWVLGMRIALWIALKRKKPLTSIPVSGTTVQTTPVTSMPQQPLHISQPLSHEENTKIH